MQEHTITWKVVNYRIVLCGIFSTFLSCYLNVEGPNCGHFVCSSITTKLKISHWFCSAALLSHLLCISRYCWSMVQINWFSFCFLLGHYLFTLWLICDSAFMIIMCFHLCAFTLTAVLKLNSFVFTMLFIIQLLKVEPLASSWSWIPRQTTIQKNMEDWTTQL